MNNTSPENPRILLVELPELVLGSNSFAGNDYTKCGYSLGIEITRSSPRIVGTCDPPASPSRGILLLTYFCWKYGEAVCCGLGRLLRAAHRGTLSLAGKALRAVGIKDQCCS